jgi:four helix bundle protein
VPSTRYALRRKKGSISYRSVAISNGKIPYIEFANGKHIDKKGAITVADNKNQLRDETIDFAIAVSDVCDNIQGCSVYVNQLLRCSSSIGANVHEAKYAQSRADFISKLEIALKESSETDYWLELLYRKQKLSNECYTALKNQCGTIRRKLIASVTTAKANNGGAHGKT